MKNKITSIIMFLVVILIVGVIVLFGEIIWQDIKSLQTTIEPESVKTEFYTSNTITENNIETSNTIDNKLDKIIDYDSVEPNNNNNEINNRFFYKQLNQNSKLFYDAFDKNKENMKTGTYKIELGNSFTNLLNSENGEDELGKDFQSAIEAYNYDNPIVFYLNPNKMYLNIETITKFNKKTYNVYVNNGNELSYLIDEFSSKQEVNEAISKIEEVKNKIIQNRSGNTYNDIKMVHDYLVNNVDYDTSISKENIYNLYGALVNGESVCEGYARAFKYIMDEIGIPCTLVRGMGQNSEGETENHAWNYVQLDGTWYAIDCTWDDPIMSNGWSSNQRNKYKYFLKGSNDMSIDHVVSNRFSDDGKIFTYPDLSVISY